MYHQHINKDVYTVHKCYTGRLELIPLADSDDQVVCVCKLAIKPYLLLMSHYLIYIS